MVPTTRILPVPHYRQKADGYYLPACAQMILAHLGISRSQEALARQLGLRPSLGVPAPNILRLTQSGLEVTYASGELDDLQRAVRLGQPIIAFVQAGELAHWHGHTFQHAVVVVGMDNLEREPLTVYALDPAAGTEPIPTPIGDFLLAWAEVDNTFSTITRKEK